MRLTDKVVLITDGASITGLAIAELFKAEGAIIAANTCANPASKKEVDAAVASVLAQYGRIDVLVHNNNEVILSGLEDCGDELFDNALDINAKSAFLYAQAAGAFMKEERKGNFVFISSIHSEKPNGAAFAYSIAKGIVKMLAKEMVLDLGPFNVRTNIVSMGPMEGDEKLFYSGLSPLYEHTKERIVNGRCVKAEDVANAALFFASDDCPSANGSELVLDGGFLLSYYMRKKMPLPPNQAPK